MIFSLVLAYIEVCCLISRCLRMSQVFLFYNPIVLREYTLISVFLNLMRLVLRLPIRPFINMKCPFLFLLVVPVLSLFCLILISPLYLSFNCYLHDIFFLHLVSNSESKVCLLGKTNKQANIHTSGSYFFFQSENYCLCIRVFSLFTFNIIVNIVGFMFAILLFVLICVLSSIVPSLLIYVK